jgi:trehalose-6-phosphatase
MCFEVSPVGLGLLNCFSKETEVLLLFSCCRWNRSSVWETSPVSADLDWKNIVEPVMRLYTEATDGSNIEVKESALVWHHHDADPDFGSCQAKELLDHLESVLANEPAIVNRGQHIVEVKPQVCLLPALFLGFSTHVSEVEFLIKPCHTHRE